MQTLKQLSDMRGRRILITGAAGHLGKTIADAVAELGADLILLDRSEASLKNLQEALISRWGINASILNCDLESQIDRCKAIKKIKADGKGLDGLVNNAAFVGSSDLAGWNVAFEDQSLDSWRRAMEVNLTSPFHLCQALAPELRNGKSPTIVNVSSIYGRFGVDWRLYENSTMANPAAYSVSKGGINQLTRWLATTLAPAIRVNAIAPGGILRDQPQSFRDRYSARTPLGRMATEDDLKGPIAFLLSDQSLYMTGQILHVDAGWGVW